MRKALLTTTMLVFAGAAHAQTIQSGTIGGMPYYLLPASGGCSAQTPCSVVTYLGVQSESSGAIQADVTNYFGGAFSQANPHTIVIAPTENGPQDATINWGGYNTPTTPEQAQMVAVVQGVEQQMGNTVNPADSVVTGGSLGGTGTQSALIAYGPKGIVQPGVFSAGLSFDAADWSAAGNPTQIAALCGVPLTAVHGTADTNQSITFDQNLAAAINGNPACGNSFTLVPIQGAGHGTWSGPSGYSAGVGAGTPLGTLSDDLTSTPTTTVTASALTASPAATAASTAAASPTAAVSPATTTTFPQSPPGAATGSKPVTEENSLAQSLSAGGSSTVTPGQGSVTDCSGNTWTINSNNEILENGRPVLSGGDTASLTIQSCTIYGQDNGHGGNTANSGGWFTLSGGAWQIAPAPPTTGSTSGTFSVAAAPASASAPSTTAVNSCPAAAASSGGFHVVNAQIIGPNGQPFVARGVNLYDFDMGSAAGSITTIFPGLNFIRVNVHSYPDPTTYDAFVNQMTAKGIVVEFEDHPNAGGGQGSIYTGSQLASELQWYGNTAVHFKGNPYVWFGTFNEPPTSPGSLSQWQLQTYQAIRNAGSTSPILLEISGWAGAWNNAMDPSVYLQMTNTVWDAHFYGWVAKYSTDQSSVDAALADEVSGVQAIPSADGTMPVMIAEYGNSTDGTTVDPNGIQAVTSVINRGAAGKNGSAAWNWNPGGAADHLLNGDLTATTDPYGQMVQLYIDTDVVPLTTCQATANAQAQLTAMTAQVAAGGQTPQTAAPATTQPATASSAASDPTTDALSQAAGASIAQANAIIGAAQQQMQANPAASP
jgi:hypothetical protein